MLDDQWEGTEFAEDRRPVVKPLPEDPEAEKMLLANIFAPGCDDLAAEAADEVSPDWFNAPQHRMIFEAGVRLVNSGTEISFISLNDELGKNSNKCGGITGLISLLQDVDSSDWRPYAKIIRSKWEARTAIIALSRAQRSIETDGEVGISLSGLSSLLGALEPQQKAIVDHSELLDLASSGVALIPPERASNRPIFGVDFLDSQLNATAGRFGVIAAKTSAGKSSIAYQIVARSCSMNRRVLMVSLESDKEEVVGAIAANMGHLNRGAVMRYGTGGFDSDVLPLVKANFAGYYASSGSSWDSLERAIRAEHRRRPFEVVIVDYFTLLQPPEYKGRNLASLYGEISKAGKRLAQELECSVIFLSQFNRGIEDGQEPYLENLRETGQLEQDADWVVLMWSKPDDEPDGTRLVYAKGAKNRGGKRNFRGKMTFYPAESRFVENFSETDPFKPRRGRA
jgi:replicative DNA helicase